MQTITVYSYDRDTGEYRGETVAHENPRRPGVYLLPAFSTEAAPPATGEHEAAVYRDGAWSIVPDWRGHEYWLADGSRHEITELGIEPPAEALDEQPLPPLAEAISERIAGVKREAHARLAPYDWYWIRKQRTGEEVPPAVVSYYTDVTALCDQVEAVIADLTDTADVLAYEIAWPAAPHY